jgi:hypothetical protein
MVSSAPPAAIHTTDSQPGQKLAPAPSAAIFAINRDLGEDSQEKETQ